MANKIEISCNFSSVFAQFTNLEDLQMAANSIVAQLKDAVSLRAEEIQAKPTASSVVVSVKGKTRTTTTTAKAGTKAKKTAEPTPQPQAKKTAKTKAKAEDDVEIAITDTAAIKKLGLSFEKYNDKSWALYGDTKPLRKVLREQFKGVFNKNLKGRAGWAFRNENAAECAKALGLKVKIA